MLDADLTNRECPESRRNPPFFLRNRCGDDDKHSEPLEQRQRNEKKEKEAQLVSHATYGLVGFCCCFLYRLSDSDLCTGSLSCLLFYGASSQCCVSSCPLFPSLLGSLSLSLSLSIFVFDGFSLSLSLSLFVFDVFSLSLSLSLCWVLSFSLCLFLVLSESLSLSLGSFKVTS